MVRQNARFYLFCNEFWNLFWEKRENNFNFFQDLLQIVLALVLYVTEANLYDPSILLKVGLSRSVVVELALPE